MTPSRNLAPSARRLFPIMLALALGVPAAQAVACSSFGQTANLVVDQEVVNDHRPGIVLTGWLGFVSVNIAQVRDCTRDSLPMEINPSFTGLSPVGTVDHQGQQYVTYQFAANSPLLIFRHVGYAGGGTGGSGYHYTPVTVGSRATIESLRLGANNTINSTFNVALVSRGGAMQGASTNVGTATTWLRDFPSLVMQHPASITVRVNNSTCVLSDVTTALNDVSPADLAIVGATAGTVDVQVPLQCPHAGVPVKLSLSDANDAANRGSDLVPTANATAQAVRVQLLRAGVPVVLQRQWDHGLSAAGSQRIDLQARYVRTTGTLRPGVVEGQAVLTASYR